MLQDATENRGGHLRGWTLSRPLRQKLRAGTQAEACATSAQDIEARGLAADGLRSPSLQRATQETDMKVGHYNGFGDIVFAAADAKVPRWFRNQVATRQRRRTARMATYMRGSRTSDLTSQ